MRVNLMKLSILEQMPFTYFLLHSKICFSANFPFFNFRCCFQPKGNMGNVLYFSCRHDWKIYCRWTSVLIVNYEEMLGNFSPIDMVRASEGRQAFQRFLYLLLSARLFPKSSTIHDKTFFVSLAPIMLSISCCRKLNSFNLSLRTHLFRVCRKGQLIGVEICGLTIWVRIPATRCAHTCRTVVGFQLTDNEHLLKSIISQLTIDIEVVFWTCLTKEIYLI